MTPAERAAVNALSKAVAALVRENEELAQRLAKYEDVNPVTSVTEARTALTPAQKQSAYRARQSAKTLPKALPSPSKNTVTVTQKVTPVVSSYKEDLSRESLSSYREEREILSNTTSNSSGNKCGNADGNEIVSNISRLHIDPQGTDRDWRTMMRPTKRGML